MNREGGYVKRVIALLAVGQVAQRMDEGQCLTLDFQLGARLSWGKRPKPSSALSGTFPQRGKGEDIISLPADQGQNDWAQQCLFEKIAQ